MDSINLSKDQLSLCKSYFNKDFIIPGYPKYLVIEPTNCCNLNCIMCPRKDMTRPQGYMDFELYKKIIDESKDRADFIYLHFFGEPLLHPKIVDFINYAAGNGMTIALSTNATLLNEKTSRDLLQSKLDLLIISIDSLNPDRYTRIRNGGKLETVLNNIDNFLDLQQSVKSTLNISLQMIEMSLNKDEVKTFIARWKTRDGLNLTVKPLHNYADQVQNIRSLGNFPETNPDNKICVEPWRGLVIGWDGIVVPCCNDFNYKSSLGDVKVNTIAEIWNSEKIQNMRKRQSEGLQKTDKLCKGCIIHSENYLNAISDSSSFNPTRKEAFAYFDKGLMTHDIDPEFGYFCTQKYFEISVQDKFKNIIITLCNDNPYKETIGVEIRLFGKFVKSEIIGRRTEIFLQTPDHYKGRLLRYGFTLDRDGIPREAGINDDSRRIGVSVAKIVN